MRSLENSRLLSKIATNDGHGEDTPYFEGWKAYDRDPFHLTKNPTGVIQMGLAENQVYIFIVVFFVFILTKILFRTLEKRRFLRYLFVV